MNKASRIKLAKQLLHCARMILDASLFNQDVTKQAKVLIAWDNQTLKKAILRADRSIVDDLRRFGISRKIYGVGYVLHHFQNSPTHYLERESKDYSAKFLADVLDGKQENETLKKQLQEEIKYIVLLPEWFHNWCHQHPAQLNNLKSRKDYYNLMAACLKNKRIYENIKELQFNDKTVYSALKSIENLALTLEKTYKKKVIDKLEKLFNELQDAVKEYLRKNSF